MFKNVKKFKFSSNSNGVKSKQKNTWIAYAKITDRKVTDPKVAGTKKDRIQTNWYQSNGFQTDTKVNGTTI